MKISSLEERLHFVELARAGTPASVIAAQTGWSHSTVRKWRRRMRQQGRSALTSVLGRPRQGALSAFPPDLRAALHCCPGWGAKTLRTELEGDPRFQQQRLPARRSIARWLQTEGLSHAREPHQVLPTPLRHPSRRPTKNGRWMPAARSGCRGWAW